MTLFGRSWSAFLVPDKIARPDILNHGFHLGKVYEFSADKAPLDPWPAGGVKRGLEHVGVGYRHGLLSLRPGDNVFDIVKGRHLAVRVRHCSEEVSVCLGN